MADPTDSKRTDGAPPSHIHIEKGKPVNWLAWLALLLGLLALAYLLLRHRGEERTTTTVATTTAPADGASAIATTTTASVGVLAPYLAGNEATPRTFAFDTMHFATASSELTAADRSTVEQVAGVLGKYPSAKVKVVGYADARGSSAANSKLGQDRADAVKAALVGKGVTGANVATGTGGANDPVDTNTTASGQAENRRTELVIVSR